MDIFKEEQAKSGTPARGRQALLMIHKHFSTSRRHGEAYDIEDLMAVMAVTLVNDDLRGFITRWDAVIAGMTSEPDTMWKQAYFHNAIKNFKPLSHDLAVYDRALEGEPNRSYEFVMKAARDFLERKRLEKMRRQERSNFLERHRESAMIFRQANASEVRIADTNMRSQTKVKVEVRKENLDPTPEAPVVHCLLENVIVVVSVHSSIRPSLQLRLPVYQNDKCGESKNKRKKKKKGDRSRSSSRGSDSSKGSQSLKDKGCIQDGWDFVWKSFSRPSFKKQDGTKIKLEVKDYVPYLPSRDGQIPEFRFHGLPSAHDDSHTEESLL